MLPAHTRTRVHISFVTFTLIIIPHTRGSAEFRDELCIRRLNNNTTLRIDNLIHRHRHIVIRLQLHVHYSLPIKSLTSPIIHPTFIYIIRYKYIIHALAVIKPYPKLNVNCFTSLINCARARAKSAITRRVDFFYNNSTFPRRVGARAVIVISQRRELNGAIKRNRLAFYLGSIIRLTSHKREKEDL